MEQNEPVSDYLDRFIARFGNVKPDGKQIIEDIGKIRKNARVVKNFKTSSHSRLTDSRAFAEKEENNYTTVILELERLHNLKNDLLEKTRRKLNQVNDATEKIIHHIADSGVMNLEEIKQDCIKSIKKLDNKLISSSHQMEA